MSFMCKEPEEKSFETRFPSLKDKKVWSTDMIMKDVWIRMSDVMDDCLDKELVRKAIIEAGLHMKDPDTFVPYAKYLQKRLDL